MELKQSKENTKSTVKSVLEGLRRGKDGALSRFHRIDLAITESSYEKKTTVSASITAAIAVGDFIITTQKPTWESVVAFGSIMNFGFVSAYFAVTYGKMTNAYAKARDKLNALKSISFRKKQQIAVAQGLNGTLKKTAA